MKITNTPYAVFLDIDGTLYVHGAVPEENVAAIRDARRLGHFVFINTARSRAAIPDRQAEIRDRIAALESERARRNQTLGRLIEQLTGFKPGLGMTTIIIAHITFCMSYVAMVVLARLQDFDYALVEAAQDLGANSFQTFMKVTLPVILPAVLCMTILLIMVCGGVIFYFRDLVSAAEKLFNL